MLKITEMRKIVQFVRQHNFLYNHYTRTISLQLEMCTTANIATLLTQILIEKHNLFNMLWFEAASPGSHCNASRWEQAFTGYRSCWNSKIHSSHPCQMFERAAIDRPPLEWILTSLNNRLLEIRLQFNCHLLLYWQLTALVWLAGCLHNVLQ